MAALLVCMTSPPLFDFPPFASSLDPSHPAFSNPLSDSPRGQLPCPGTAAEQMPVVREGGLRVVVAANSFALLPPASTPCPSPSPRSPANRPPGTPIAFAAHPFATVPTRRCLRETERSRGEEDDG